MLDGGQGRYEPSFGRSPKGILPSLVAANAVGFGEAETHRAMAIKRPATNNTIKLFIHGFRNIENLIPFVMLICSKVQIPLSNRP